MSPDNGDKKESKKSCLACGAELPAGMTVCPKDGTYLVGGADEELLGTTLAERYEVLSVIGEGGMGVVYKARHLLMDRIVAIKTLHSHLAANATTTKRFKREATLVSDLEHPNIITVYDFGVTPKGQPYLVLSYLEGTGLDEIIKAEGYVKLDRALKIFSQVADGLAHAHQKGIVHRDLKPSNIMLVNGEGGETVKIVDFGIAKAIPESGRDPMALTQAGETFGSPLYMSPEQCMGTALDSRSDIYSLGCVMYEALTGRVPIKGHTTVETMTRHVSHPPLAFKTVCPERGLPQEVEHIVLRTLRKEPNERYQSMAELKQDIDEVAGFSTGVRATGTREIPIMPAAVSAPQPVSVPQPAPAASGSRKILIGALVVVLLAAVVIAVNNVPELRRAADEGVDSVQRVFGR